MTDKPMSDFERACAAYWLGQFRRPWQCRSWQKADEAERDNVRRGMAAALREMQVFSEDLQDKAQFVVEAAAWQPIESAPKDGTWVLVCGNDWDVTMAWYAENRRTGRAYWKADQEWDDYDLADRQPTHWQPLPAPPPPGLEPDSEQD